MTISSTNRRNDYTGNGSVSQYSYTFLIRSASDLLVITKLISTGVQTTLTLNVDYTVSGAGNSSGGTITLLAGNLPSTTAITIRRVRPLTQLTDIRNQGDFFPEVHEDEFDNLAMVDLQQQDSIDRSVKLPETVTSSSFDPTLPANLSANPGATVAVNSGGNGFAIGPSATDIANAAANAAAAAASAVAAAGSATAASTSATNASSSASAAAASAAAAQAGPVISGSWAAPNSITAVGGITPPTSSVIHTFAMFVKGSGGAVTISANPQIGAGANIGDRLILIGTDNVNTLTLNHGTGLTQNGEIILSAGSTVEYIWGGSTPGWIQINRNGA